MALLCSLFGHFWNQNSLCKRCGEIRDNFPQLDGCRCSHCGETLYDSSIVNWSYDNRKYIFEKKCRKCGEKTVSQEYVPFEKMLLGRSII